MTPSLHELARPLVATADLTASLRVGMAAHVVEVQSNSSRLVALLREYFAPFLADRRQPDVVVVAIEADMPDFGVPLADWPRDPGKVGRKEEYADIDGGRLIRKVRTGLQFLVGSGHRLAVGPCVENENQIVNFVNAQFITDFLDRGYVLCHAAGVVAGGRGLAIAGLSGGGKSTLAMHLMSSGCDFTSNDRLMVRRAGRGIEMAGIPKLPRINPGTVLNNPDLAGILSKERREELDEMDDAELWELEEKYDVPIVDVFGRERFAMANRLDAFVILNWSRNGTAKVRLRPVDLRDRPDLLGAVMKPAGPFYMPPDGSAPPAPMSIEVEEYLAQLGDAPVFEASGSVDFAAAVEACRAVLSGARAGP